MRGVAGFRHAILVVAQSFDMQAAFYRGVSGFVCSHATSHQSAARLWLDLLIPGRRVAKLDGLNEVADVKFMCVLGGLGWQRSHHRSLSGAHARR